MAASSFSEDVRSVLADPLSLPQEFLDYLIQYQAQNQLPVAKTSGQRIATGIHTSNVGTAGTTFATGADVLTTALEFTATGNNSYIVRALGTGWTNSIAGSENVLCLNLDGAYGGLLAVANIEANNHFGVMTGTGYITPSAGEHSVNARLIVTGGTGTINAGSGGAGAPLPFVLTIEVA